MESSQVSDFTSESKNSDSRAGDSQTRQKLINEYISAPPSPGNQGENTAGSSNKIQILPGLPPLMHRLRNLTPSVT